MQRKYDTSRITDEEKIKQAGLILDFDDIARKGAMSGEEALIAKWYGIYRSRQTGDHMARIVIPAGKITSVQARAIADLSEKYARGKISFTTRQAAQFHHLQIKELPDFLRDVKTAGMTTFHGCGDVSRNVTACPWAAFCSHRRFDVTPYAFQTATLLSASRDLDNLPRKFKASFSGCEGLCSQPHINGVGAIAVKRQTADGRIEDGFRVVIGGGMGWKPFIAQAIYSFVPAEQIAAVSRAIGLLYCEQGDRKRRMYARLKFVVDRLGVDGCRQLLEPILQREGIDSSRFETAPIDDNAPAVPERPLAETNPVDNDGLAIQRIMIPKGELSATALLKIAELSEQYGDKHIYSTNRQNLEIHSVNPNKVIELRQRIKALSFGTQQFFGLADIVSCVGTTYCPLAVTRTHDVFDQLKELVARDRYRSIQSKAVINITGCPNACGQYRVADIGLRGLRIREQSGSTESYQLSLGGTHQTLGLLVGDFKLADCVSAIKAVLDTFLKANEENNWPSLAAHIEAAGVESYQQAIAYFNNSYEKAAKPCEYSKQDSLCEQKLDFKTLAKDIPCQAECPAGTHIPDYIQLISEGKFQEAHLINQEDNVLPGVLGRICTRPCEDRCRHQWTNTLGPVRICHLKRSAVDNKTSASQPLPAYFETSGKKVAVIGGGPAGLAAARELKRYGHDVVLFDNQSQLGGQVRSGVPGFRLSRTVLDKDIQAIIDSGIETKLGATIDQAAMTTFIADYDAVLVATGANVPRSLTFKGLDTNAFSEGLEFMKQYNENESLQVGQNVIVIGGGFTAVDCSRSARRIAPEANITIMYRRGVAQMAANEEELHELATENIHIETLVTPASCQINDGKLASVTFQRNTLGQVDESGKPSFHSVSDSDFDRPCDTLILAIGQTPDKTLLPEGVIFSDGHSTTQAGLYVAGDFATGNGDVIHAIADAKTAADEIDTYLSGRMRRKSVVEIAPADEVGRVREYDMIEPPAMSILPEDQRDGNQEVELGLTAGNTDLHSKRCYLCNHKFEIDQDTCIHCDWCIRVSPRNCIHRLSAIETDGNGIIKSVTKVDASKPEETTFIWIDSDQCIRCGNCINICPVGAISLKKATQCRNDCS